MRDPCRRGRDLGFCAGGLGFGMHRPAGGEREEDDGDGVDEEIWSGRVGAGARWGREGVTHGHGSRVTSTTANSWKMTRYSEGRGSQAHRLNR